jgi:hypothetical protein
MTIDETLTKFIHDWPLPDAPIEDSFVVLGCSHTTGVGLQNSEAYPSLLSDHYQLPVYNLAVGNGNADVCKLNMYQLQLAQEKRPKFIVIQWPNPIRKIIWHERKNDIFGVLENINNGSDTFRQLVAVSQLQFYLDWVYSISGINSLCRSVGVPVVHIYLDQIEQRFKDALANDMTVHLHCDEKEPGRTWFFDNGASDGMHHSLQCHRQWTERLIPLIDEATNR